MNLPTTEMCPICGTPLNHLPELVHQGKLFTCPRCGKFALSSQAQRYLSMLMGEYENSKANLSYRIRSMPRDSGYPLLTDDVIRKMLKEPLPTPQEQADLLLRWLAENTERPGKAVSVNMRTDQSLVGADSIEELLYVLHHLEDIGLILIRSGPRSGPDVVLSFKGWERYQEIRRGGISYHKAFMAMKFGDDTLDRLVNDIFKPSVAETGFELVRLDDHPQAGLIDDRLRVAIQGADFLIADVTHDNLGAYWEAGYAEGLGKPVIYTCEQSKWDNEGSHFDTNHHLTIIWDTDNLEDAGKRLKDTIRATLPHIAKPEVQA